MLKRILTALIGICIMLPFIFFSHTVPLMVFTCVLSAVGVYEILKCLGKSDNLVLLVLSVSFTLSAQLLTRLLDSDYRYLGTMLLITVVFSFVSMVSAVVSKGKTSIADAVLLNGFTVYISFGFASLILLRDTEHGKYSKYGLVIFLLAFIIPWLCDAMAYFTGRFLGKHKLIPDVSPKKTVEGAIGGVVGAMLLTAVFGLVMQFSFGWTPNYLMLMLVTFVGCIVSQFGDLVASLLKREHGIKDYGKLFPGHGGVMDRFDSCIATAPFIYLVCVIFSQYPLFY